MRKLKAIEPPTSEAVMDLFGGMPGTRRLVSEVLGEVSQQRVQHWKYKNQFPKGTYEFFKQKLEEKGYTAPAALWGQAVVTEAAE
jgi:hypothetical protein